jgi:hypothetical protein
MLAALLRPLIDRNSFQVRSQTNDNQMTGIEVNGYRIIYSLPLIEENMTWKTCPKKWMPMEF